MDELDSRVGGVPFFVQAHSLDDVFAIWKGMHLLTSFDCNWSLRALGLPGEEDDPVASLFKY